MIVWLTVEEGISMKQTQQIIIVVLAVAVVVLGYLYYERSRNDIVIQIPNIQINP
jgi:Tfp pilus assembly protein PilO